MSYPILEHDPTREAFIEPIKVANRDVPEACVITFFMDVIEKVKAEHNATVLFDNKWEDGPHPLYEIEHKGERLAFFHPGIGGPMSGGLLEEIIASGCRKFIACGGCGVLTDLALGHPIVVSAAVRDEGTSYHYLPPGREVTANERGVQVLIDALESKDIPYEVGKTWTTDAPYRETVNKINQRREEGCIAVEMEAASLMSIAQFRGVPFGQVLYAGDNLSGAEWDHRSWQSRADVREQLFWVAADAVLGMGE